MVFDSSELCMFDSIAGEHIEAYGTDLRFWHQDHEHTKRDALYDEPVDRAFKGPYLLKGYVEYAGGTPEMTEQGMRVTWAGNIWIARSSLEAANAPAPLEGDVISYWDVPFFAEHAVNSEEPVPGKMYAFDVVNSDDDGHVFDSEAFLYFKLDVRRRTEFTPERRLAG